MRGKTEQRVMDDPMTRKCACELHCILLMDLGEGAWKEHALVGVWFHALDGSLLDAHSSFWFNDRIIY